MSGNVYNDNIKVINFSTNTIDASIDIERLDKIISLPEITPIAHGPSFIIGVMNYGGVVVPLVDLSMRIQRINPHKYHINIPILICNTTKGGKIGLIIQDVYDFCVIDRGCIGKYELSNDKIYDGVIKYSSKLSLLINVDHVVDDSVDVEEVDNDDTR